MLIGDISGSDQVGNFFKAVEAARKRTTAAADSGGNGFSSMPIRKSMNTAAAVSPRTLQNYGYKSGFGGVFGW